MSEENKPATQVAKKNPGHRFQEGHPRWGGKKRNTAQRARELADELGCDPLAFMMNLINSDTYQQTVIGPDGKKKKVEIAVTMDLRLDAAKTVVNYLYPRLNAQQVTGADDRPLAVGVLDMNNLLADPAALEAAQTLSLHLSGFEVDSVPQPATDSPNQRAKPAQDPLSDLAKNSRGHWV